MARKQPLYPHVPKTRHSTVANRTGLRFLPDSPEILAQTVSATGYRTKLEQVFLQAIARAQGAG